MNFILFKLTKEYILKVLIVGNENENVVDIKLNPLWFIV